MGYGRFETAADSSGKSSDDRERRIRELGRQLGLGAMSGADQFAAAVNEANSAAVAALLGLSGNSSVLRVRQAVMDLIGDSGPHAASRLAGSPVGLQVRLDALESGHALSRAELHQAIASRVTFGGRRFCPSFDEILETKRAEAASRGSAATRSSVEAGSGSVASAAGRRFCPDFEEMKRRRPAN